MDKKKILYICLNKIAYLDKKMFVMSCVKVHLYTMSTSRIKIRNENNLK